MKRTFTHLALVYCVGSYVGFLIFFALSPLWWSSSSRSRLAGLCRSTDCSPPSPCRCCPLPPSRAAGSGNSCLHILADLSLVPDRNVQAAPQSACIAAPKVGLKTTSRYSPCGERSSISLNSSACSLRPSGSWSVCRRKTPHPPRRVGHRCDILDVHAAGDPLADKPRRNCGEFLAAIAVGFSFRRAFRSMGLAPSFANRCFSRRSRSSSSAI